MERSDDSRQRQAAFDRTLSAPPRTVPVRFVLAELLPFRWWYLFALFIVAVPAAIVWALTPAAAAPAAVATLFLIYCWQLKGAWTRFAVLRWGEVATVTDAEIVDQATYYGGVTWYNAPLPIARGWKVDRPLWSGPSTKTRIRYALGRYQGELDVRGREYIDGVILADQRHPQRALCVTSFAYDLDRDEAGNWTGALRPRLILGMAVWLVVIIAWLATATAITSGYATRLLQTAQTITAGPGTVARVEGSSLTRQVECDGGGDVIVDGNHNIVTVTGHCTTLTVDGNRNTVTIDAVDTIDVSAIEARVVYHEGHPKVTVFGINNSVTKSSGATGR